MKNYNEEQSIKTDDQIEESFEQTGLEAPDEPVYRKGYAPIMTYFCEQLEHEVVVYPVGPRYSEWWF